MHQSLPVPSRREGAVWAAESGARGGGGNGGGDDEPRRGGAREGSRVERERGFKVGGEQREEEGLPAAELRRTEDPRSVHTSGSAAVWAY